jgi:hypothetical protein
MHGDRPGEAMYFTCVPVVEGKTNKNVEITLQHLVATHKAPHLTLAVFHQSSHLRGGR